MKADAYAKINLALIVHSATADRLHPLQGLFQSVSLADTVEIVSSDTDEIVVSNDEAPEDESNLAWKALDAMRRARRVGSPMRLEITKRIPAGAGLGGGSADAAAVIGLMGDGIDPEVRTDVAVSLGSDVPFSLIGGTAIVRGTGEMIEPIAPLDGFALLLIVPPFELSTPAVFREWDRLDEPEGKAMSDADLPPVLRSREPMRNDLVPAAVSLEPRLGEWMAELEGDLGVPISMTGSGSGLFSYMSTIDEAVDAARSVRLPARAVEAVTCVRSGWVRVDA